MRTTLLYVALLTSALASLGADSPDAPAGEASVQKSIELPAKLMTIATGQPSLVLMSNGDEHTPTWSLSGGTVGQSVVGLVNDLPRDCNAVKVEIVVTTNEPATSPEFSDVYRVHLLQAVENGANAYFKTHTHQGALVRTALPAGPFHTRTILLTPNGEVTPNAPLWVRIQREPGDPGDTFVRPTGLVAVKVTPIAAPAQTHVVQDVKGYNSWPMMQAIGDKLVCVYSRGSGHPIAEDRRAVYARTSTNGGKTWTAETTVADTPGAGEVAVGKGLDSTGAMLLWVRRIESGGKFNHDLYRTTDGATFTRVATPPLEVQPMQITDVFAVPKVGLMALWFAGDYRDEPTSSWGVVTSSDDGAAWKQTVVEAKLPKTEWPTEPAAVYLGEGRILAVARTETGPTQFQLTSTDYGTTWKRERTNIDDVHASTPSLILDAQTGLVSNYYYHRGKGRLRRRVVDAQSIFDKPTLWPASEVVAAGSDVTFDAANANATVIGDAHYISFYSGQGADTSVVVAAIPAPTAKPSPAAPSTPTGS